MPKGALLEPKYLLAATQTPPDRNITVCEIDGRNKPFDLPALCFVKPTVVLTYSNMELTCRRDLPDIIQEVIAQFNEP